MIVGASVTGVASSIGRAARRALAGRVGAKVTCLAARGSAQRASPGAVARAGGARLMMRVRTGGPGAKPVWLAVAGGYISADAIYRALTVRQIADLANPARGRSATDAIHTVAAPTLRSRRAGLARNLFALPTGTGVASVAGAVIGTGGGTVAARAQIAISTFDGCARRACPIAVARSARAHLVLRIRALTAIRRARVATPLLALPRGVALAVVATRASVVACAMRFRGARRHLTADAVDDARAILQTTRHARAATRARAADAIDTITTVAIEGRRAGRAER